MKKLSILVAVMMLAMTVLSGCGGTQAPAASGGQGGQSAASSTGGGDIASVPREKTLIFENIEGRVSDPGNQNPFSSAQYLDWGLWQANQESLFYLNYETGEIMPWQASGYQFNDDFTELTITLRDGVKWQDGEAFNADDVIFTIDMLKKHEGLRYSSDMNEWVASVEKVDDLTVKFVLTSPKPSFLVDYFANRVWNTLPIAPEHIWSKVDDPVNFSNYDLEAGLPLGTGPYKLVRSSETEQVYDLCDTWWGAETGFTDMPEPQRCIWVTCTSEEVRAAKMVNNELDSSWTMSVSTFETAKAKNPNVFAWTDELPYGYLDACPSILAFNNDKAPFNDPEIRWAIAYAVNQQEIVDIAAEGGSEPAQTMYPTYESLKAWLESNQDILDKYDATTYDLGKVDEIMQSKGYTKDSSGMWTDAGGNHFTINILYRSGESLNVKEAPIIEQQLKKAGFDASAQALESAVFYTKVYSGDFDMCFGGALGSVTDAYATMDFFHSKYYKPIGEATDSRYYRWVNKNFDALVDTMAALAPDDPKFLEAARGSLEIWLRELPCLPLMQQMFIVPFNSTYWTNWPTADNNYTSPTSWWYNCNLLIHNVRSTAA